MSAVGRGSVLGPRSHIDRWDDPATRLPVDRGVLRRGIAVDLRAGDVDVSFMPATSEGVPAFRVGPDAVLEDDLADLEPSSVGGEPRSLLGQLVIGTADVDRVPVAVLREPVGRVVTDVLDDVGAEVPR